MPMNARRFCPESRQRSNRPGERGGKQSAHALEILLRVDARCRRAASDADDDPMSVPKRTQLFQRLEALDRRWRERRVVAQKAYPISVKTVVAIQGQAERNFFRRRGEIIACPRYRRPAEVQR